MTVLTPSLLVTPSISVEKIRELPVKGTITKKVGDIVLAHEVVAHAELPGDLEIVRISERLGLEPFEVAESLKFKVGDKVSRGDVLCEHVGLFGLLRSEIKSEVDGTVEFFAERTGHLAIRLAPKYIELKAYISGVVSKVETGKSVTIQSFALLVQGIFGVGGERNGVLQILDIPGSKRVEKVDIPTECKGKVLIGGSNPSLEALKLASDRGAVGFVTGGIDDAVLKGYVGTDIGVAVTGDEDVSMSLIVTEGFGATDMSERIINLLKTANGKDVSINGTTQVRAGAVRPEIIVCHAEQNKNQSPVKLGGLEIGQKIRLIRFPYFGKLAEIVELPHAPEVIQTGAHARVLRAKIEGGEVVTVPRANVELI